MTAPAATSGPGAVEWAPLPPSRPEVIVFDVLETLFSLEPLRETLLAAGFPPCGLEWWFAEVLRDGFALAVVGEFVPFADVARHVLGSIAARLAVPVRPGFVEGVVAAMSSLPAQPDAVASVRRAATSGTRVVALTNGSAEVTAVLLERAGLAPSVESVVSIDEVGQWKPAPEVYLHTARQAGVAPEAAALVAVHGWDVNGAGHAGLVTGWASRRERIAGPVLRRPDVVGDSVLEVVDGLLAFAPAAT